MKKVIFFLTIIIITTSCKPGKINQVKEDNKEFANLLDKYYNDRMQMFPWIATTYGDNRFNNLLPADFTDSYYKKFNDFFNSYKVSLSAFRRENLDESDKISYDILKYEIDMGLEGLANHQTGNGDMDTDENKYFPFDQFKGIPLALVTMGSGTGNQPFKTPTDYDNWLQRSAAFSSWTDSAIVYKLCFTKSSGNKNDSADAGNGYRFC
jgi:uncharacterized protein (DUF885 family)